MEIFSRRRLVALFWLVLFGVAFAFYTNGISHNPPGFYLDESAPAYNAYLVAHTGAGEFGPRFPLYFQYYTDTWVQIGCPLQVYLYAILWRFFPPNILLARVFSAFLVFLSGVLLGVLAKQITGRRVVGVIVGATALATPWFFEARGLLLEPQFLPIALAPFLLVLYRAQQKERWSWSDAVLLAVTLALVTYCYTSGRLLGPLLAFGLFLFATSKDRLISVIKAWVFYGVTLIPLAIYIKRNPGVLTKRLVEISYIRPGMPLKEILPQFVRRYLEDQNLTDLLMLGDSYARHHVPGAGGAFFFSAFILVVLGLIVVLARRWDQPWWRYILYGLAVSVVPGALASWPFHQMRLMAYPVFLTVLIAPAVDWLVSRNETQIEPSLSQVRLTGFGSTPRAVRLVFLLCILAFMTVEAYRFQTVFRRDGPNRMFHFDINYKAAYEAAVKQPIRPIYLEDGKWGPAYIHAFWYATLEKRPISEFVHLRGQQKAPPGKVVISTNETCDHCETIARSGVYYVFKTL
jgi:hypothetical protein